MKLLEEDEVGAIVLQMRRAMPLTGCSFASGHAKPNGRIDWLVFSGQPGRRIHALADAHLDVAADRSSAVVLVFPEVRSEAGVAKLLRQLADGQRWAIELAPRKRHPHDELLVGLWWTTKAGDRSSAMGLAPFGCMPPTRRFPFVAIAVWPGGRENPHRSDASDVGFVDMPLPRELRPREKYDAAWDKTRARVKQLRAYPLDGAARPDVAFVLPKRFRRGFGG